MDIVARLRGTLAHPLRRDGVEAGIPLAVLVELALANGEGWLAQWTARSVLSKARSAGELEGDESRGFRLTLSARHSARRGRSEADWHRELVVVCDQWRTIRRDDAQVYALRFRVAHRIAAGDIQGALDALWEQPYLHERLRIGGEGERRAIGQEFEALAGYGRRIQLMARVWNKEVVSRRTVGGALEALMERQSPLLAGPPALGTPRQAPERIILRELSAHGSHVLWHSGPERVVNVSFCRARRRVLEVGETAATVWSLRTGRVVATVGADDDGDGHNRIPYIAGALTVGPGGASFATLATDEGLEIWRLSTGRRVAVLPTAGPPEGLCAFGVETVAFREGGTLRVIHPADGGTEARREPADVWAVGDAPMRLAFARDRSLTLEVDRQRAHVSPGDNPHAARIVALAWGPGRLVVSRDADDHHVIWEVTDTARVAMVVRRLQGRAVRRLAALDPTGQTLLAATDDGLWQHFDGAWREKRWRQKLSGGTSWLGANADGRYAAVDDSGRVVCGHRPYRLGGLEDPDPELRPLGSAGWAATRGQWLDDKLLLLAGGAARLVDTEFGVDWPPDHVSAPIEAVMTPCERFAVTGDLASTRLWDVAAGRCIWRWTSLEAPNGLTIREDGGRVASVEGDQVLLLTAGDSGREHISRVAEAGLRWAGAETQPRQPAADRPVAAGPWRLDEERSFLVTKDGAVRVLDAGGGTTEVGRLGSVGRLWGCPRTGRVASQSGTTLQVARVQPWSTVRLECPENLTGVAFLSAERIACSGRFGVRIIESPSGGTVSSWSPGVVVDTVAAAGGEQLVAVVDGTVRFLEVPVQDGATAVLGSTGLSAAWHPTRLVVACGTTSGEIEVFEWHPDAGTAERVRTVPPDDEGSVAGVVWGTGDPEPGRGGVWDPVSVSPDGRWVARVDGTALLIEAR